MVLCGIVVGSIDGECLTVHKLKDEGTNETDGETAKQEAKDLRVGEGGTHKKTISKASKCMDLSVF